MGNMSYCRFENTYRDLNDCIGKIEEVIETENNDISSGEQAWAKHLYRACQEFVDKYEEMQSMLERREVL